MQEQRVKQEAERQRAFDSQFGGFPASSPSQHTLGDGRSTPNGFKGQPATTMTRDNGGLFLSNSNTNNRPFTKLPPVSTHSSAQPIAESEDDILAAFSASAPVDKSSHMPIPSHSDSMNLNMNGGKQAANVTERTPNGSRIEKVDDSDDDDDPFGLGMGPPKAILSEKAAVSGNGSTPSEDDVLGMLSRPISEFPPQEPKAVKPLQQDASISKNPRIRALNELAEMGFEPAKCRMALESTESGVDVQAAVSWLLNQAHEESKTKNKNSNMTEGARNGAMEGQQPRRAQNRRDSSNAAGARPAWMSEAGTDQRRQDSRSPAKGDKDPAQYASELGSSLFKTANSLWKTGQKKLNQAVAEFNTADNVDQNQPKWMKDASHETTPHRSHTPQRENVSKHRGDDSEQGSVQSRKLATKPDVTDEALLLEGGSKPSSRRTAAQTRPEPAFKTLDTSRDEASLRFPKAQEEMPMQPKFMRQTPRDPRSKLSKQAVEDEAAEAYISPARRKRTAPKPSITQPAPEPDLLFNGDDSNEPPKPPASNGPTPPAPQARSITSRPLPQRAPVSRRTIPSLSSIALQSSTASRKAGTESFKRGDYAHATLEYTKALGSLPPTHPLAIVVLTNRALSHSKTGDPKASIADATTTIEMIGLSRGVGESIDLGGDEGSKPMDSYWGKAMQRKAEGLEQLERWADAAAAWRSCVEVGVGGATSITGRNRCENASNPKPPPAATKKPRPRPKPSALGDLAPESAQSAEAVSRLRAANAAADKLDDEKFRLADIVDDRVSRWRAGKEGNLRALLASLEIVLWEDAGWKKTGMGELIQTNKVKIVYMRGISKVHPDKVSNTSLVFVLYNRRQH